MLYFPRTLALVVGLAGPAAGFGSMKPSGGSTLIEVSTESAGDDFKRPNLRCCPGPDGDIPSECYLAAGGFDCVPPDTCELIGVNKGLGLTGGTIQTGGDWCGSAVAKIFDANGDPDYVAREAACSGGNILRAQDNVITKNGPGVEYLICSWDSNNNVCRLAGWSLYCTTNEIPPGQNVSYGCPGVEPIETAKGDPATFKGDIIVATKCGRKMEKSFLSTNKYGNPRYTQAMSCEQKLLDCGGAKGVRASGGADAVNTICNTVKGVTWDDCCNTASDDRRFRELEEKHEEKTAPAAEKRESRRSLQDTCNGELKTMTDKDGQFDGECCVSTNPVQINVLGDKNTWKGDAIAAPSTTYETCVYTSIAGDDDECECSTTNTTGASSPDNCQFGYPWPWN